MLVKTIFAGFGGQGVLSIGLNLAQAALQEGKNVTYLPAYGVEVRGGTANCTVAVSDEEIASPVASAPEYVVAMNQPSLIRFQNQVNSGGAVFLNSSLIEMEITRDDIEAVKVPASEIAEKIKSPRSANMVMLGAFIKKTKLVTLNTTFEVLKVQMASKARLLDINKQALTAGYELFK